MISQTITDQEWGTEHRVTCQDCGYYRNWASGNAADNDQLTHEC